ncbi:hypothetical protein R1flu_002268 [Riccia fluitans]|uniref:Uncharacterized protein n=1 Tax=Riccia fluitans TaxID=41844 RepID=A0ABD1Y5L6_9MARC
MPHHIARTGQGQENSGANCEDGNKIEEAALQKPNVKWHSTPRQTALPYNHVERSVLPFLPQSQSSAQWRLLSSIVLLHLADFERTVLQSLTPGRIRSHSKRYHCN